MKARGWLAGGIAAAALGGAVSAIAPRVPRLNLRARVPSRPPGNSAGDRPHDAIPYMHGLDGLRALGVLAVLLYHADVGWMKGGFLGVELFFVVSGFLITTILLAELNSRGRLDLRQFWLRRARRLLPAAFSLITATLLFGVVFLPEEVASLRGDALAGFGYFSNWFLIFNDQSYFESVGRPSLLRHLWSLAVEEQFYLLWPLALVAVLGRIPRWSAYVLVLGLAAASAGLMAYLYDPAADPSRVYYGTDTRLAGILVGAALAFLWSSGAARERIARIPWPVMDFAGLLALAGVIYAFVSVGEYDAQLYRGGFAVFALAGAVLIAAAANPESRLSALVLSRQPLRYLGLRSYSIYLWHWPVFMLTRPQLDVQIDGIELLAVRFAIVLALAEVSYRFVETPFRSGAAGRFAAWLLRPRRSIRAVTVQWVAPASTACALILAVSLSVAAAEPPKPPSYLSVGHIQTTSWSDAAPKATATPGLTPRPATATAAPTTSPPPVTSASSPSPEPPASTAAPVTDPPPTEPPAPTPEPTPAPTVAPTAPPVPPAPPPAGRVFAIGDSVMLGAASHLPHYLGDVEVDAAVGRQASEALSILRWRHENGLLGDIVVLHIGNNGIFTASQLEEAMQLLSGVSRVAIVNVKVPRQWEGPNNDALAGSVPNYGNAVLVDWHGASTPHPHLLHADGIHLRSDGAAYYAQLIAAALDGM